MNHTNFSGFLDFCLTIIVINWNFVCLLNVDPSTLFFKYVFQVCMSTSVQYWIRMWCCVPVHIVINGSVCNFVAVVVFVFHGFLIISYYFFHSLFFVVFFLSVCFIGFGVRHNETRKQNTAKYSYIIIVYGNCEYKRLICAFTRPFVQSANAYTTTSQQCLILWYT